MRDMKGLIPTAKEEKKALDWASKNPGISSCQLSL